MFWIVSFFFFVPNIKPRFNYPRGDTNWVNGSGTTWWGTNNNMTKYTTEARSDSSVYGNSTTVQPNSIRCIFVIKF